MLISLLFTFHKFNHVPEYLDKFGHDFRKVLGGVRVVFHLDHSVVLSLTLSLSTYPVLIATPPVLASAQESQDTFWKITEKKQP